MVEDVVDVGLAGCRVCLVEVPRGVGGADDPVPAPRDDEQDRRLGAGDEAGLRSDPVARHHQVDALAGLDVEGTATADHLLDLVGPDAGGVDHDARPHLEVAFVLEVAGPDADHPLALLEEAGHLHPGRDVRAMTGRGARDRHHQPGVVDLAVVVEDRAGDRLGLEVGCDPRDLPLEEVTMAGETHLVLAEHRHRVVERQPGADVRPLPDAVGQRVEEGHRPDQVRRQPGEQQSALLQGLADQAEVEHLEVAQAAVDQLAAAAAGAAGEVALFEQTGVEPAGHGIESRARTNDPAADHEHVELGVGRHRRDRGVAGVRAERGGAVRAGSWSDSSRLCAQPTRCPESLLSAERHPKDRPWARLCPHRYGAGRASRRRLPTPRHPPPYPRSSCKPTASRRCSPLPTRHRSRNPRTKRRPRAGPPS